MRVFTILGVLFLVLGVGLLVMSAMPAGGSMGGFGAMGAGIAALTFIPMGIVFTVIGVAFGRLSAGRNRLLREGIPGQATILSVSGGNMVVNNVNYLMTFQLSVAMPGRPPYQVRHRQLVPIFAMASLPVGSTVPVMIDPRHPTRLTIDLSGEAVAMRQAATVAAGAPGQAGSGAPRPETPTGQVVPNTLSTMRGAAPNTFTSDLPTSTGTPQAATWQMPEGQAAALGAVMDQLARAGISIDPGVLGQAAVTVGPTTTIDLRQPATGQAAQAQLLANGLPGSAFIREARDSGLVIQGDSVVELMLDVTPQGGAPYPVSTAALVPAAARARALPGATVALRIDPTQPTNVVVDWGS
ncbi:MAG: hypothetical protein U0667_18190 [Chloroflexota bacterium]